MTFICCLTAMSIFKMIFRSPINRDANCAETCYRKSMDEYQKEQLDAFLMAKEYVDCLTPDNKKALLSLIKRYLDYRRQVDGFLETHFSGICTQNCYENNKSACCSKEGIITFFADTVINVLMSSEAQINALCGRLRTENKGFKCIYLGPSGCLWQIKPIVCEMFLCDPAKNQAFGENPELVKKWEVLRKTEKDFKWPDKPVLFDEIEEIFITAGYTSPLMYLHNSPGLLRVKQQAGNYPK